MADPMNGPEPAASGPPVAAAATGPGSPDPEPPTPRAPTAPQAPGAAAEPAVPAVPAEPSGPRPLGVAVAPTGQPAVDAGLARLAEADHLPVGGHLGMYEDVHRGLRDVLASLDQHSGPPAPSPTPDRPDRHDQ
ncbi:hypothetical protein [Streptomyces noursei]|uniref:hypothetical protein n=1 Tax=Streptomyces noursei TaxID=1971 RepID=UPI000A9434FD|nr:hypothetical protein [Streptomyces noursei]